jgi:hypothetical protein
VRPHDVRGDPHGAVAGGRQQGLQPGRKGAGNRPVHRYLPAQRVLQADVGHRDQPRIPRQAERLHAAAEFSTATACGEKTGAFEINWWDGFLTSTLLPSLRAQGVTESTLPIFLLRDVVSFDTVPSNCCILGYHSVTSTALGRQTYAVADYESSGRFSGAHDISPLSHEVAEWQDDPFGANPTKPWGNIGQVAGCQTNLEVGDPLSGTNLTVATSGHTYHPQELAFFSWFYHSSPSLGVNGLFSNNGTFTSSAPACH